MLEEKSLEQVVSSKEQETYEYVEVYNPLKNSYELYEASSYWNNSSKVENMSINKTMPYILTIKLPYQEK